VRSLLAVEVRGIIRIQKWKFIIWESGSIWTQENAIFLVSFKFIFLEVIDPLLFSQQLVLNK